MLSLLHIENIAVIESADIEFYPGLNVLTGETGAGKSIIIDAISAVIGERTSRDILRTGAKHATVSAQFTALPHLQWFEDNGIFPEDDGCVVLQRKLTPDGRNICRVNGQPVALNQLKMLGQQLLNIHGQHDSQQLLNEDTHLYYLDLFAECDDEKNSFISEYSKFLELKQKIDELTIDAAEKQRRIETLQYQINELENAALMEGEDEKLYERRSILKNFGRISNSLNAAHYALSGGEESEGAVSLLYSAADELENLSELGEEFSNLFSKLTDIKYLAEDVSENVRDLLSNLEFSELELDEVETRIAQLDKLKRKYGNTVEEMLSFLENCKTELDEIEQSDNTLVILEKQFQAQKKLTEEQAHILSKTRHNAGDILTQRIQDELSQLDMKGVRFAVKIETKPIDMTGCDSVCFLLSANLGEEPKPINRIASGGELARIMLAMKNVLAERDMVSTMVFDEVDSGVSGRAAGKVAEKMSDIAKTKQVFCVTHLPQTAAMADEQYLVEKKQRNGRTYTEVVRLDRKGRIAEIARLTGGENITDTLLKGAEELLLAGEEYKKNRK